MAAITVSKAKEGTLRGYRGIRDITFDLDSTLLTDSGWVIFEVNDEGAESGLGVIGTFNHHVTLQLIRFARNQKPCRIVGVFDEEETGERTFLLDDVRFTAVLVRDISGLIGFRSGTVRRI